MLVLGLELHIGERPFYLGVLIGDVQIIGYRGLRVDIPDVLGVGLGHSYLHVARAWGLVFQRVAWTDGATYLDVARGEQLDCALKPICRARCRPARRSSARSR